ncbi:hypothetical protein [Amycolatopsis sp. NPDC051371]|uniref:hypothetical protein n=1 Tax=Amycolatopsis sp. NPDC051371 TaxID=3155800 RepID=UPI00341E4603
MIVETSVVPRAGDEPCADRLVLGEHVLGVADGATKKPWDTGPDGAELAGAVAGHLLAARLARDPLMIDPPETKGLRPAANSFDDRAYLRVRL